MRLKEDFTYYLTERYPDEIFICSKCYGRGIYKIDGSYYFCKRCKGWGRIDWINHALGGDCNEKN